MTGSDVKAFQHDLNRRFRAWGSKQRVREDGVYGMNTRLAARRVLRRLGFDLEDAPARDHAGHAARRPQGAASRRRKPKPPGEGPSKPASGPARSRVRRLRRRAACRRRSASTAAATRTSSSARPRRHGLAGLARLRDPRQGVGLPATSTAPTTAVAPTRSEAGRAPRSRCTEENYKQYRAHRQRRQGRQRRRADAAHVPGLSGARGQARRLLEGRAEHPRRVRGAGGRTSSAWAARARVSAPTTAAEPDARRYATERPGAPGRVAADPRRASPSRRRRRSSRRPAQPAHAGAAEGAANVSRPRAACAARTCALAGNAAQAVPHLAGRLPARRRRPLRARHPHGHERSS